jgi:hypothetical protein
MKNDNIQAPALADVKDASDEPQDETPRLINPQDGHYRLPSLLLAQLSHQK